MNPEKRRMIEIIKQDPLISATGLHENHDFTGNILAVHYLTAKREALKQKAGSGKDEHV